MTPQKQTSVKFDLAVIPLHDAYTDFILSRQAMALSASTMQFYFYTTGKFLTWIESQGVTNPGEVTARHVRSYLAELRDRGLKDTSLNAHARAIRTLCIFWFNEKYTPEKITFEMPKIGKKRLPVLSADEVTNLLSQCNVRDKAIISLMVDSGLRRQEVCNLIWGDIKFQTGLIKVKSGKGNKDRSSVVGATARRALVAYRRTLENSRESSPVFQTQTGTRFTGSGLLQMFRRLEKRTGLTFSPHALRRSCAILSLRAGISPLTLQSILGHESLEMVKHYAQMDDEDIIESHIYHSPLDNIRTLKR